MQKYNQKIPHTGDKESLNQCGQKDGCNFGEVAYFMFLKKNVEVAWTFLYIFFYRLLDGGWGGWGGVGGGSTNESP